jgi:hypothetical protein
MIRSLLMSITPECSSCFFGSAPWAGRVGRNGIWNKDWGVAFERPYASFRNERSLSASRAVGHRFACPHLVYGWSAGNAGEHCSPLRFGPGGKSGILMARIYWGKRQVKFEASSLLPAPL